MRLFRAKQFHRSSSAGFGSNSAFLDPPQNAKPSLKLQEAPLRLACRRSRLERAGCHFIDAHAI